MSGDVDERLHDVDEDINGMNDKKGEHDDDDGQEDHDDDDDENNAVKSFPDKITAEDTKWNNWNYGDHNEEEQEDREETMKEIETLHLDDAHDNNAAKLGIVAPVVDLFAKRFSCPPLPEISKPWTRKFLVSKKRVPSMPRNCRFAQGWKSRYRHTG